MSQELPGSVLFCCDHNAVRSPMAEGLMKKFYGHRAYVQSAGVKGDLEIDGFSIAVCAELGVELSRHRSRSFDEMQEWGDDLAAFEAYERALSVLRADGLVYPCTCSRREIAEIASAPHDGEAPRYPGTCRAGVTHPDRMAAAGAEWPSLAPRPSGSEPRQWPGHAGPHRTLHTEAREPRSR